MHELETLRAELASFTKLEFPRGLGGEQFDGVELAEIDSFLAGYISQIADGVPLQSEDLQGLAWALSEINRVLPHLEGNGQVYFATLANLGQHAYALVRV